MFPSIKTENILEKTEITSSNFEVTAAKHQIVQAAQVVQTPIRMLRIVIMFDQDLDPFYNPLMIVFNVFVSNSLWTDQYARNHCMIMYRLLSI